MTVKEAERRGYRFTGVYYLDKEETKARKAEFKGFKTLLVFEPSSKYSRGFRSGGWSIYAEPKYFTMKLIKELEEKINYEKTELELLEKEYLKKIDEVKRKAAENRKLLLEMNEKLLSEENF
ncbi:MAG TPA: hypothetical protein DHS57_07865 [Erysipelotrichaceae bacterium]|nr:hypothetical protein [Erysipelotrichaceae bacterium]